MTTVVDRHRARGPITDTSSLIRGEICIDDGIASSLHKSVIGFEERKIKHVPVCSNGKGGFLRPRRAIFDEAAVGTAIHRTLNDRFRLNAPLRLQISYQF